jgi:hypothetical protein
MGCSRVTHFSNPDISTLGYPTGIADLRDNARTGDASAPVVELFRSTNTPPDTDTVLAVRVTQGSDDAEQATISGSMLLTSSELDLGYDSPTQQTVGLRFQSLTIPPGSTITSAHIEFERDETETGVAALTIHGQAADNPATFSSTGFNITNRSTTSSSVAWNPPEWDSGSERHFTPDLTTIVQELADRGGWASGNSMVFLIAGSGQRTAEAFEGEPQNAPMLHVTFNDGSTPISNSFVNVRITNGNDDVEELVSNGDMLMNSSDLEMVDDSGSHGGDQIVGLRFPVLAIPWGSTIVASHIEFESDETNSENTSLTIHAEDIDDAPVFSSSDYDVSGRSPTTSSASWNPAEWSTANQKHLTSDLAEVVQEVVDRGGWQADNDMAFMISGSGKRVAESYDGDAPNAALLHVEFRSCDESQDLPGGVWVLFSLPCTPKNNTVAAIFSGLDTDDYLVEWAVIEFDAVSGSYAYRYPGDTLAGKRGYWFIKTGADYTLNLDGMENRNGLIALDTDAVNGRNNLAGHTARVSLPWAGVTVMDGASELTLNQADPDLGGGTGLACDQDPVPASCIMSRKMHLWNGTAYQAYDGSTPLMEGTLSVFDGFWVKAFKSGIELNLPAAPAPGRATKGGGDQAFFDAYRHGGEWAVRLVAEYEGLIDPGNVFGQLAGAKNAQDSHDMEELTPFGEPWLTIVFANKGWEPVPWGYTSDFRAVTRSLQGSWRFTVKASEGIPGAWLRWDGPAEIIHSARLVDERSGKKYDIEPGGSLWVSFGRSEAWFRFEL